MVTLIGIGCGEREGLTLSALEAIRNADLILGAKRMLAVLPPHDCEDVPAYRAEDILALIREKDPRRVCVVYSGDPGFYSGCEKLYTLLRENGIETRILPGISSMQMFAARLGRPWKDWTLCSAHGVSCDIVKAVSKGKPVFCLTGGTDGPAELCRLLLNAGMGELTVTVGERLSYPEERITTNTARYVSALHYDPLNVMLIEPPSVPPYRAPGIPDGEFLRGAVPMTKQEVRAVLLSKLQVKPTDVCWDVGAGTGSVSVELALHSRQVWAVEYREEACVLIQENRARFSARNLNLVVGKAPDMLRSLPDPDKVFVGGSEGALREILRLAVERNPLVRICVSAVTLDTLQTAMDEMTALRLEPEVIQISVSRARPAGTKRLLTAQNPVFLITGGGT